MASIICQALEIGHVEQPDELPTSDGHLMEGHDVEAPVLTSVVHWLRKGPADFLRHTQRVGPHLLGRAGSADSIRTRGDSACGFSA